ncbi:proteoglycan 4a [Gouania willdenowi]|uniref:proteoglycan 4a n=1 Tax=Gouania willdenowi TaxID=441366 RepID=UPI0010544400|nr:proteoglycan 4-like [Gouania willdenowi]
MCLMLILLGLVATSVSAGPGSCSGRCGEVFLRGQRCACDVKCLQHNECCQDFKDVCSTAKSCRGRCGDTWRRGQSCDCHPLCVRFNTCCHDYQLHCDAKGPRTTLSQRATTPGKQKSNQNQQDSNSESEELYTGSRQQKPGAGCLSSSDVRPAGSSNPAPPALPANPLQHGVNINNAAAHVLLFPTYGHFPPPGSSLLNPGGPVRPSASAALGNPVNVQFVMSPGGLGPHQGDPTFFRPRPILLQDVAQILGFTVMGRPGGGVSADILLCDDTPINGLTSLNNGTILIFKGDYFWSVDPVSRLVGPSQSITDTLGVPSPVDTIFTRFDCLKNTYIIKGDQIWCLDVNMMLEAGYPKPVSAEFPGLTGSISAALVVPGTSNTPETVFFFKPGDIMQSFTFPPASDPSCIKLPESFLYKQTDGPLSVEFNITVTMKDFPVPVTSALTLQNTETYEHYIFSGHLFYNVQISNDIPVLTKPDPATMFGPPPILAVVLLSSSPQSPDLPPPPPPANSIRVWLRCVSEY